MIPSPGFHHVEIWVPAIDEARREWDWMLERVGFVLSSEWTGGCSWSAGESYLTLTTSPNLVGAEHDRRRPGMNHLAFVAGPTNEVDRIIAEAPEHGWRPLYADRYPHAGGPDHYAGWVENSAGFKVELVGHGVSTRP